MGYISQIERGVTKVNLDTLSEIACILERDLGELVMGLSSGGEDYLAWELSAILDSMDHRQHRAYSWIWPRQWPTGTRPPPEAKQDRPGGILCATKGRSVETWSGGTA